MKFIEPLPGTRKKHYQYTAIDDCTRIRALKIYPRNDQKTAIQFVDYVLEKFPFPVEVIQTDNGSEFQSGFHWHVLDRGIRHVYIKPATPRLNGKVERSHRIDAEEFYRMLDGVVIDDTELFNDKLQEWENFYNFNRPHGGLDGQTPYERLRRRPPRPRPRRKPSPSVAQSRIFGKSWVVACSQLSPLGEMASDLAFWSGWRDSNPRPLDPQSNESRQIGTYVIHICAGHSTSPLHKVTHNCVTCLVTSPLARPLDSGSRGPSRRGRSKRWQDDATTAPVPSATTTNAAAGNAGSRCTSTARSNGQW